MAETPAQLHAEVEKYEQKHAENPEGRNFVPLANAYRKMGEFDLAERLLRDGLRLHPDYLSAHIVLGRTLADRGSAAEAAAEFHHVLGIDPQNLIALRTLGELAAGEGRPDEAGHWYRELLAVDPMNDDARRALAEIEAPEQADEAFESRAEWWSGAQDDGLAEAPGAEGEPSPAAATEDAQPTDAGVEPLTDWAEVADSDAAALEAGVPEWMSEISATLEHVEPGDEVIAEGTWPPLAPGDDAETTEEFASGAGYDAGEFAGLDEPDEQLFAPEFEAAGPAVFPDELASETLAELYARQGFPDEAAEVYRELIRRRGSEPALARRLAELEALAMHAAAPVPPVLEPMGSVSLDETQGEPADALAIAASGAAAAQAGALGSFAVADTFADSFAFGFAGEDADGLAPEQQDAEVAVASATDIESQWEPDATGVVSATPEEGAGAVPLEHAAVLTVRDYFGRLLGWRPGPPAATAAAEATPAPTGEARADLDERGERGETLSELEAGTGFAEAEGPVSRDDAQAGSGFAAAADAGRGSEPPSDGETGERFPWELPGTSEPAPRREPEGRPESAHSALFDDLDELEDSAGGPARPGTAGARAGAGEKPDAERNPRSFGSGQADDDDLESFQAWLRSLKR